MQLDSLRDVYIHELQDLVDAETRLIDALPKMASKASSPKLKKALQEHLKVTQQQLDRLQEIFSDLEEDSEGEPCKAMIGLIKEGEDLLKAKGDETAIDAALIASGNRIEHYEIAAYGAARSFADVLGFPKQAKLLQKTLDEEAAADEKLTAIASELNPQAADADGQENGSSARGRSKSRATARAGR